MTNLSTQFSTNQTFLIANPEIKKRTARRLSFFNISIILNQCHLVSGGW
jgi:hypothetical protein